MERIEKKAKSDIVQIEMPPRDYGDEQPAKEAVPQKAVVKQT